MNKLKMLAEREKTAPHIYAGLSFAKVEELSTEEILKKVSEVFDVKPEDITGKSRRHEYVMARRAFCAFLSRSTHITRQKLGKYIDRDHSSVVHTLKKHNEWMQYYPQYSEKYGRLLSSIYLLEGKTVNDTK
jgi:chromosomal replication initiation ATPase DnaA